MARVALFAGWALMIGACAPENQQRLRDYTDDGVQLFKAGDYGHARETFQAALALRPGDPNLVYDLGQCSERMGQYSVAEQRYQQCLQMAPNHVECRFALVSLWLRENRQAEAKKMTDDWLASQPRLAGPYVVDAWLWRQAGDLPRAQLRLQQALALEPENPQALTELGQVYEAMNRPDRAYILYEHSLDANPNQPDVQARLAALKSQGAGRPRPD